MMNQDLTYRPFIEITLIALLIVLSIIAYGTYRCKVLHYQDPLTFEVVKGVDGWSATHFVFYGVLAYFYPSWPSLVFIATLGVIWEIIETIFEDHPFYLSKCNYNVTTEDGKGWWYGRSSDIVANTLGMACGVALRKWKS
jgi:hypothetical protein